jgi:hypothetical protein
MLNDSWAGQNPNRFVVPIEEEEDEQEMSEIWLKICIGLQVK